MNEIAYITSGIQKKIKSKNIDIAVVAEMLNVSRSTVYNILTNKTVLNMKTLIKICSYFNCTIGDLLIEGSADFDNSTYEIYNKAAIERNKNKYEARIQSLELQLERQGDENRVLVRMCNEMSQELGVLKCRGRVGEVRV
jgi:transcriptional regulator with XRE-family HTH domain